MADNTILNSGTGGDTIASDDIGGVKHQRVKIEYGDDGAATDVSDTNPLPVDDAGGSLTVDTAGDGTDGAAHGASQTGLRALGSDGTNDQQVSVNASGHVNIADGGNTITVDGTVTADAGTGPFPVSDNAGSLTVDAPIATPVNVQISDGTDTALVSAAGAVNIDGSGVTQPVSAAALPLPSGAATAAAQLADGHNVTVDNAAGASAVNVQDGGNSLTVDGTVTADAGTGPWPVTDNAGSLTVDGTVTADAGTGPWPVTDNSGSLTTDTAGDTAHDAVDAGNPLKIGAVAESTESTAVADGDRTNLMATLNGKLVVHPYAVPERLISGVTAAITGTGNTSVIAAPGAGLRNYITHCLVTNSHATVDTVVELKDGTTVLYRGFAKAAGGGFSVTLPCPLQLTANAVFNAANVTTGSNTYVSASGFIAP